MTDHCDAKTGTPRQLVTSCENALVKAHSELLQDEFQRLLDADKEEDLNRMYNLLHRIPDGLDPLRTRFEEHVKKVGLGNVERIVAAEKDAVVSKPKGMPVATYSCAYQGLCTHRNRKHTSRLCWKCTPRTQTW